MRASRPSIAVTTPQILDLMKTISVIPGMKYITKNGLVVLMETCHGHVYPFKGTTAPTERQEIHYTSEGTALQGGEYDIIATLVDPEKDLAIKTLQQIAYIMDTTDADGAVRTAQNLINMALCRIN